MDFKTNKIRFNTDNNSRNGGRGESVSRRRVNKHPNWKTGNILLILISIVFYMALL